MIKPLIIPLTKDKSTFVDPDDYEHLINYKWCLSHYGYAVRHQPKKQGGIIYMHRIIVDAQLGQDVDHINGDKLDNRKSNLRICTRQQNLLNKNVRPDNRLGIKGVRITPSGKYNVRVNKKHVGNFDSFNQAVIAYNNIAKEYHGEFANLNKVEELM